MKPALHFAHANGIPTATYKPLLDHLSQYYQVSSIAMLGHDPKYPVTNNWVHLQKQLIHSIETQNSGPVIGVGHSLGGALTLMAAVERPDLFKAVVILDVPTFSRLESLLVLTAKALGLMDSITPAKKSRTRRTHWPDRETAKQYFESRRLFSNFHPDCLQNYVDHALVTVDEEVTLAYDLDVELAVYRTIPHKMVLGRNSLKVAMGVLVGKSTDTVRKNQYLRMKNRVGFTGKRVEGSHMFPLEFPIETAKNIHLMATQLVARS
jgi:pimeloyl-ACP methyl ester carboxylesterase